MKNLFFAALSMTLLLNTGCGEQPTALLSISVDRPDKMVALKASDLMEAPEYVALETNDSCLIKRNPSFYATDDYIVSIAKRQIFLFDRKTGRFIREIGKAGQGPDEYQFTTSALPVDYERRTIAASGSKGLMRYDFEGRLVDQVASVPDKFMPDIAEVAPDLFAGYLFNSPEKLLLFNRQGEVKRVFPNYNVSEAMAMAVPYHGYYRQGANIYLCEWFNDTIFTVLPDALVPHIVLERGAHQLSMERLAQGESKEMHFPLTAYESSHFLFHTYAFDGQPYLFVYDKRSHEGVLNQKADLIADDFERRGAMRLSTVEGERFVGYIAAEDATALGEEDNPIVVIAKLK